jgi:hypothetical protein
MQGEKTLNDLWSKQWKIFTKGEFGFVLEFIDKRKSFGSLIGTPTSFLCAN